MRKTIFICSILVLMVIAGGLGATAATAARPDRFGPRGPNGPLARLMQATRGRAMTLHAELNLSEEQHTAVHETIMAHKQELATAMQPAVTAKRALRDAVLAEKPDDAAIHKAAEDLGSKVGAAAVVVAKVKGDVLAKVNLTPEQRKKIDDFFKANDASVDELFAHIGER